MIWQLIDSSGFGGCESHITLLTRSLRARGLQAEVVLYERNPDNPWLAQLAAAGIDAIMLEGRFHALLTALRRERPSLLHTHGYKAGILGRLAARLAGVPVVSSYHSGEHFDWPVSLYDRVDRWSAFLGEAIAVSAPIRRRIPFRATLVPNYVDVPAGPPPAPETREIAFAGRLTAVKGPDLFCELARRTAADRPSGEVWRVYGDGPMRAELEQEYGDVVSFEGFAKDMSAVWPRTALLALTSRAEGLPLAALEAGAAGRPILSSAVGDLPELIRQGETGTGWLFPAGDLDAAAEALRAWRQLDPASATALSQRCWRRIAEHYSEAAQLQKILKIYRRAGFRATEAPRAEQRLAG